MTARSVNEAALDFLRDWEIFRDDLRVLRRGRGKAGLLRTDRPIAASFRRLFLGGLLPSRARFRFTG